MDKWMTFGVVLLGLSWLVAFLTGRSMPYNTESHAVYAICHLLFGIALAVIAVSQFDGFPKQALFVLTCVLAWEFYEGLWFVEPLDTLSDLIFGVAPILLIRFGEVNGRHEA